MTDTIVTYTPVALFIMQDRSGSMVTGFPPPASAQSWSNSAAAVTAFVQDPASQGIDIGMGEFPAGQNNTASCSDGADCGNPVVPIASLPGNAPAMVNAYQTQTPSSPIALTPTECGLRGMINTCLAYQANSGEACVAILITDGTPTQCDTTQSDLVQIVADGLAKGVSTFTLGLPGADLNSLNQLAQAGGTTASINVSGGSQAVLDALNQIRKKVVNTSTKHITKPVVISTQLPCQWKIPPTSNGQPFDKDKVNFQVTDPQGAQAQYGRVESDSQCARASDGWYYDDNSAPTQIIVCPNTCNTLKASTGAAVQILFGCPTVIIPFN